MSTLQAVNTNIHVPTTLDIADYVVPEPNAGEIGLTTRSFDDGTVGDPALGNDAFTGDVYTIGQGSRYVSGNTTAPANGAQCCICQIKEGSSGSGGEWGGTINTPDLGEGDEFWYAVKMKTPAFFDFSGANPGMKLLRMEMVGTAGNIWHHDMYINSNGISAQSELSDFYVYYLNDRKNLGGSIARDVWTDFEIYVKFSATNGQAESRWWKDGVLLFETTLSKTLNKSSDLCKRLMFLTYFNDSPTVGGSPIDQYLYVDTIRYTSQTPSGRDNMGNPAITGRN